MKNRLGIQYISSSNTNVASWNNNLTSGQNLGKMGTNSGSLIRKFNHCKGSGVPDVLECTLNPGCCPQKQEEEIEEIQIYSVAGGIYQDTNKSTYPFVYNQVNGEWDSVATDISFSNAATDPNALISTVSSSAPGYAVAGGLYNDRNNKTLAFVVNQKEGVWDSFVTDISFVNAATNPYAVIFMSSVSSSAPGYAVAGGLYQDTNNKTQAFVVNQKEGVWDSVATDISFVNAFTNPNAGIISVSSSDPSYAVAGGFYQDANNHRQAFVINQVKGTWDSVATDISFVNAAPNPFASITSVSSSAHGYAVAGGSYNDANGGYQAFVVNQAYGTWGTPTDISFINPPTYQFPSITSVSSSAPDHAVAVGYFQGKSSSRSKSFIINQTNGHWDTTATFVDFANLAIDPYSVINSVSSPAPNYAVAGGTYLDSENRTQAFVINQVKGTWQQPLQITLPYDACLNSTVVGRVCSVSASAPGYAVAGGTYKNTTGFYESFVINQVNGIWQQPAIKVPGSSYSRIKDILQPIHVSSVAKKVKVKVKK